MLSAEEIANFNDNGFVVIDDVLSSTEIAALIEAASSPRVMAAVRELPYEDQLIHVVEITLMHRAFEDLVRDPRIVDRVAALIGPDLQLVHSKLAAKPLTKGTGAFYWHQDFAYSPHSNSDVVTVAVMLDDATPDNGCMYAVRGSHRIGPLSHEVDGWFVGSAAKSLELATPENTVGLTPRAGGISIHHCLTLHSSPVNRSGEPRRAIVFMYRAADAVQVSFPIFRDCGLQVRGKPSRVVRCDRTEIIIPMLREQHRLAPVALQQGSWVLEKSRKA
jgi:ectoine hydroxylase-related dioxygenase (phytanoyl-CoA dioxygenase family)